MTTSRIERYGYRLTVGVLSVAIGLVGGFLLAALLPEVTGHVDQPVASPTTNAAPTSTPAPGNVPIGLQVMPDTECTACHLDPSGAIGAARATVMGHPLEGWKDCTACHADDRLVKTAPGHSGIHKSDCLACHEVPDAQDTAPPRPHHLVTGATCVSCHGTEAPLPTDMAGRNNCWICHGGAEFSELFGGPVPTLLPLPSVLPGG